MIESQLPVPAADDQPAVSWSAAQPATLQELRCGDWCPQCYAAPLDYNGLLNLACPLCGYSQGAVLPDNPVCCSVGAERVGTE